jgi:hypothetical protein
MFIDSFFRSRRRRRKSDPVIVEPEDSSSVDSSNLISDSCESEPAKPRTKRFYLLVLLISSLITTSLTWLVLRSSISKVSTVAPQLKAGLTSTVPLGKPIVPPPRIVTPPSGWRIMPLKAGIVAYHAPEAEVPVFLPGSTVKQNWFAGGFGADSFDGTRYPYLLEVSQADLKPVAPGQFVWSGVWEGEGYDRVLNRQGQLVSLREAGADIHLSLIWDATITDATKSNLIVTVQSEQSQTGQLTNFSAFLNDPNTKKTLERKDLGQLPPIYQVTLDSRGRLISESTKTLQPLGTVTFAYHIPPAELNAHLPITMEAVNQLFDQRLKDIAELEAAGWVVEEVPAPGEPNVS